MPKVRLALSGRARQAWAASEGEHDVHVHSVDTTFGLVYLPVVDCDTGEVPFELCVSRPLLSAEGPLAVRDRSGHVEMRIAAEDLSGLVAEVEKHVAESTIPSAVIDALSRLDNPHIDTRTAALDDLIRLGRSAAPAITRVLDVLRNDPSPEVRQLAVVAARDVSPDATRGIAFESPSSDFGVRMVTAAVREALRDPSADVQGSAAAVLLDMGATDSDIVRLVASALAEPLPPRDWQGALIRLENLGKRAEPAIPQLVSFGDRVLSGEPCPGEVLDSLIDTLRAIGDRSPEVVALLARLNDSPRGKGAPQGDGLMHELERQDD
jgi:hypothetical protein